MSLASKARVAVVGATGYAGAELVRLLARHPSVQITAATSEREAGRGLGEVHPHLDFAGLTLTNAKDASAARSADIAFVALPHGSSAALVAELLDAGVRVVDLGADFRFADRKLYESWYGPHPQAGLLAEAVYGLTEHAREQVSAARLVANPGCYPTGALMALLPLASEIRGNVVVDSKSGTSGAGRGATTSQLYAEVAENVRPYKVGVHRHQPEIASRLEAGLRASGGETKPCPVLFVPQLVPMARGILTCCYVEAGGADVGEALRGTYSNDPFVRLLDEGAVPEPRNVRGTNLVEIAWRRDESSGLTVLLTAIDNLGKGAAGQAVQNMNLMLGFDETAGLELTAALP